MPARSLRRSLAAPAVIIIIALAAGLVAAALLVVFGLPYGGSHREAFAHFYTFPGNGNFTHLHMDADITNGTRPCDPIDETATVEVGTKHKVGVCIKDYLPNSVEAFVLHIRYTGDPASPPTMLNIALDPQGSEEPQNGGTGPNCVATGCLDDNPDANDDPRAVSAPGENGGGRASCQNGADDDGDSLIDAADTADCYLDPVTAHPEVLGRWWDCTGLGPSLPVGDRPSTPNVADAAIVCSAHFVLTERELALDPGLLATIEFTATKVGDDTIDFGPIDATNQNAVGYPRPPWNWPGMARCGTQVPQDQVGCFGATIHKTAGLTLPFVVWPYYVVDGWGEYTGGCGGSSGAHWGIDYGAEPHPYLDCWQLAEDTPIVAAAGGEAMASSGGDYGNFVLIWHGNGYSTLYAHLDRYADVFDGHVCPDRFNCNDWVAVERGRVIGYAGQSGTFYRHLHFEAAKNAATDPVSRYAEHCANKIDPYDISVPGNIRDRDHYPDFDSPSESCGAEHLWQRCPPTIANPITLADLTQLVEPLAEKWLALSVPSLLKLIVTVLWQGSDIDVTLISPGGRTITCPTADPDVVCDESATSTTITLDTPELGEWMIGLFGADVPPGGEQVSSVVTGEPIPIPVAVGGVAELPDIASTSAEEAAGPAEGSDWPAGNYAALAGVGAVSAAAIAAAGWYARRRWLR